MSVIWGDWSITQATINGIAEIDKNESNYSHICLLSGQCYPIKSNEEILNTIQEGKDYMEYLAFSDSADYHKNLLLTGWWYAPRSPKLRWLSTKFTGFYQKILHIKRKPLPNVTFYWGSAWWTLSRDSIKYILNFVNNSQNIKFLKFFKWTLTSDEIFFHCILLNSDRKDNIINNNLRCIVWRGEENTWMTTWKKEDDQPSPKKVFFSFKTRSVGSPETLIAEDYDNIIKSDKLFCRKVDSVQSQELIAKLNEYRNT